MPNAPDATDRYRAVRARTRALAAPLSPEDAQLQSMPEASPVKWHLAHTTWFFARFALGDGPDDLPAGWDRLFNSYYLGAGVPHARVARGQASRPSLDEVLAWRDEVDALVMERLQAGGCDADLVDVVMLGTHHEEQHQELLLTDIKHAFWSSPLQPAYAAEGAPPDALDAPGMASGWLDFEERIASIGAAPWPGPSAPFAFDNETPRHRVLLPAYRIARLPVTNAEYADFVRDGGYRTPALWLSDGWDLVQREGWQHPLYWHEDGVREFTLGGWRERRGDAPVRHLSHYEADAFARWAGARLPTEAEWESAADVLERRGEAWEWTASAYAPYPRFRPLAGTLGEYNGKFMSGQMVLRGGSCATPPGHARATYRNFFPPQARWQFSGLRLARDAA